MNSPLAAAPAQPPTTRLLRVLVADDDPGSCRFLQDGLLALGTRPETCPDGLSALDRARRENFDLLLLDCRMPGAGALGVLNQLRADTLALSSGSVAVATTADLAPGERQPLMTAGFSDILLKPCRLTDLQRILELVQPERADAGVLDDRAALTATGDAATMQALRLLLREELALLHQELDTLGKDPAALGERLHRLRSSCGFCGAATLSSQVVLLQQRLSQDGATAASLARFRAAVLATLHALDR